MTPYSHIQDKHHGLQFFGVIVPLLRAYCMTGTQTRKASWVEERLKTLRWDE